MVKINKKILTRVMVGIAVLLIVLATPLSATQTLGELEAQIEQIKEDTAKQAEKQKDLESAKVETKSDISDVKAEMEEINTNIANKQAEITKKQAEIDGQNKKIEEIQAKIPEVKADADKSLLVLQKVTNDNIMVEMILSPSENDGDNILRRMESVNTMAEFAGDTILDLVEIEKELKFEKTVLEKDEAELEGAQAELVTEQKTLTTKEVQLEEILESQTDASTDIEAGIKQAAEDKAMLEDTLAYYESYGCSKDDIVGSNCGGLGDSDNDGVINDEDACPNEAGTKANGCPEPANNGGSSSGGNSGGNSGGGNASSFARPLSHGVVTTEFGGYAGHTGTDLDNADNDPVYATAKGTVITSRGGCGPWGGYLGNYCNGGYGNYVMIMHKTSSGVVFSLYGHMSSIAVSQGQSVSQGQQVGTLGNSGNSTGSHLHFEVFADSNGNGLPDDYKTDARKYVSFPSRGSWW